MISHAQTCGGDTLMKKLWLAGAALVAQIAGPAVAADWPVATPTYSYTPPPPPAICQGWLGRRESERPCSKLDHERGFRIHRLEQRVDGWRGFGTRAVAEHCPGR